MSQSELYFEHSQAKIWTIFFAKSSWSVLDDTVTERADIWGFGSTGGYNLTPHYRLVGSLHVIEIFKKIPAENRCNSVYNDPSICETSVFQDAEIWRPVTFSVGNTAGYNITPHYQLVGSLHVIEMFKKLAAENRGKNSAYNDPTNLSNRFSIMQGFRELLFFQLVVLLRRSNRCNNSFWAHRMFEISSHKVTSISKI